MQAELILKTNAILAEGSLWDDEASRLLWIDIMSGEVHAFAPASATDQLLLKIEEQIGTVVRRRRGGLVVAAKSGFAFVDEEAGALTPICNPEPDKPQNRFNDGKCDPAGRFWAGTMGRGGALYRLDADLTCRKMLDGVGISNGIVWSADAKTMYYTDTVTHEIWAFDYDNATGEISNRRTVVTVAPGEGAPDGFTIDAEGMLWVAQWNGWQVARYDPATGRKLDKIDVPAAEVSSCAFGGPGLNTLYITTAREGLTPEQRAAQPLAGSLFAARPGVVGVKANMFGG